MSDKIGAWYLKNAEALPDEIELWSKAANYSQTGSRAVGGKLFVTDRRILFCPNLLDAAMGGKQLVINKEQVSAVDVAGKGANVPDIGLRDRLRLTLTNGEEKLFVVNGIEQVVAEISSFLQRP